MNLIVHRARDSQIGKAQKKFSLLENVTDWHALLLSQGRVKFLNLEKKNKGLRELRIVFGSISVYKETRGCILEGAIETAIWEVCTFRVPQAMGEGRG